MLKKSIFILCVFCLLFFVSALSYIQAEYISIPAGAFRGETEYEAYRISFPIHWYLGAGSHLIQKEDNKGYLIAPVYFPMSYVSAIKMRVSMFDNTNTGFIKVSLIRVDCETGEWDVVYKVTSGKAAKPGGVTKTDAVGAPKSVDNSKYAWILRAWFNKADDNLALYSVRIEYQ